MLQLRPAGFHFLGPCTPWAMGSSFNFSTSAFVPAGEVSVVDQPASWRSALTRGERVQI